MRLKEIVEYAKQQNASDIHLSSGLKPIIRVCGELYFTRQPDITADECLQAIKQIATPEQLSIFEKDLEVDFAYQFEGICRVRVNAFHSTKGPCLVLRLINSEIKSLSEINAPNILTKLAGLSKGIILITGPTGSGKSTTVAALIDYINQHYAKHILSIEDPVEYIHQSKKSLINQREVGSNTKSFLNALKSALREDPDIIVVGEMRDLETIRLAMTAAETGHLVISTLHTSSAPQTIDRIIDVFPTDEKEMIRVMLSSSLEAVISQQLIPSKDNNVRVAAYEVLVSNSAIKNLIREGKIPQIYSTMQISSNIGMQTMKDSVQMLLNNNIISKEAANYALNMGDSLPPPSNPLKSSDSHF